jgi:hypothetical protein
MTIDTMLHMPLSSAYLCGDCHSIGNCSTRCPACASESVINLANIMDRETEEMKGNENGKRTGEGQAERLADDESEDAEGSGDASGAYTMGIGAVPAGIN